MRPQIGSLACLPGEGTEVRLTPSAKRTCNSAQEHTPCTKAVSTWKGSKRSPRGREASSEDAGLLQTERPESYRTTKPSKAGRGERRSTQWMQRVNSVLSCFVSIFHFLCCKLNPGPHACVAVLEK